MTLSASGMIKMLDSAINSVLPSAFCFDAWLMPTAPPAPIRFSTIIGWPSSLASGIANGRAVMSAMPPGASGTIRLTTWLFPACAIACDPAAAANRPSPSCLRVRPQRRGELAVVSVSMVSRSSQHCICPGPDCVSRRTPCFYAFPCRRCRAALAMLFASTPKKSRSTARVSLRPKPSVPRVR